MDALGRLLGVTWPALGRSWAVLGPSWALLRHLLGASWALLGVSWLVCGTFWVHFASQGRLRPRFWRVWRRAGLGFGGLRGHVLACLLLRLALHNIMLLFMQ